MLDPTYLLTYRCATCRSSCRGSRRSGREGSPPRRQSGSRWCCARMGGADPLNPYAVRFPGGSECMIRKWSARTIPETRGPSERVVPRGQVKPARSTQYGAHAHSACDDALLRPAAAAVPVTCCVASARWSARTQRASPHDSRAGASQLYAAAHAAALGTGRRDAEQAVGPRA